MELSLSRSTHPSEWSRISCPNHLVYGSSEEKESVNVLSFPSPSAALIEQSRSSRMPLFFSFGFVSVFFGAALVRICLFASAICAIVIFWRSFFFFIL